MTMSSSTMTGEDRRAAEIFAARCEQNFVRTDRLFMFLILGQWAFAIVLAAVYSPYAWAGKTHVVHAHVYVAVLLGGLVSCLPVLLAIARPGWVGTRMVIAVAQMLWSALLIHLTGGRIETHFHVFGSLAFLAFYREWQVLVPATIVVAADHFLRQMLWPESVFGVIAPESWRFLEHAAWVAFEDVFLVISCINAAGDTRTAARQQAHIELTERLEQEMQIASRIQTSILPRGTAVDGLDIAAKMLPATEVGGDYYDILPVEGGCWIGIGDVAGHGLKAGLVMLQAQSAIEALVQSSPQASPALLLGLVNRVLFENVRNRLQSDEHVTMSLIRYTNDGRIVSAGAHEEALIWRAGTGRCERLPVKGTWLGAIARIEKQTVEIEARLGDGDLLVLYTDGVTEGAPSARAEQFGLDRLSAAIEEVAREPVDRIRDHVLQAVSRWATGRQEDDVTLLVFRHLGVERSQTGKAA
jgi:serine phosphatase RsbU (regulator of sigma subunit)